MFLPIFIYCCHLFFETDVIYFLIIIYFYLVIIICNVCFFICLNLLSFEFFSVCICTSWLCIPISAMAELTWIWLSLIYFGLICLWRLLLWLHTIYILRTDTSKETIFTQFGWDWYLFAITWRHSMLYVL